MVERTVEHGFVTSVDIKDGVPVCTVQLLRVNNADEGVLVMPMHPGVYVIPEVDQKVAMLKLGDQRFITGFLDHNDPAESPSLSQGELAIQLDADTKLTFTGDGNGNYDIELSASGDVDINATGEVRINGTPQ